MINQSELKPADIIKLARKNYLVGLFCLALCLFLELWFCYFPPRGVIGENVIVVGSVIGTPLVDFNSLWAKVINDDELMLQIIEKSDICKHEDRDKILRFINDSIRQNLKFHFENKTMVRISFKRPGFKDVRPFLNLFTDIFIEKLKLMGNETFLTRREKANTNFLRMLERTRFVASFFDITSVNSLLNDSKTIISSDRLWTEMESANISSPLGRALLGELLPLYSTAQIHLEQYLRDDLKILELFPRTPEILTDRNMPPAPVQPFYQLIFILVPIATFLLYIALLILLGQKSQIAKNAGC